MSRPARRSTPGDVLASLDTASLNGALTQAQANLTSAQAKLSLDRAGPTAQNLSQAEAAVNTATVTLQSNRTSLTDTQAVNAQAVGQAWNTWVAAQNTEAANCPSGASCATDRQATIQASNSYNAAQVKAQQTSDQARARVQLGPERPSRMPRPPWRRCSRAPPAQQLQIDQIQVTVAQVSVDTAQRNLSQATLTAPVDGTVGQVNLAVGQSVSGSSSNSASGNSTAATTTSSSTTHAVSLITPGSYAVTGSVSDAQIGQVAEGRFAGVTPAGSTPGSEGGTVSAVATVATVTSRGATFGGIVTIDGDNPSLHTGVSASVSIIINQVSQVLTIPVAAVGPPVPPAARIQVLVNGNRRATPVTVGHRPSPRPDPQRAQPR